MRKCDCRRKYSTPEVMGLLSGDNGFLAVWTDGEKSIVRDTYAKDRLGAEERLIDFVLEYECEKNGWNAKTWGWVYDQRESAYHRWKHGLNPLDEIFIDGHTEHLLRRKYGMVDYDEMEGAR